MAADPRINELRLRIRAIEGGQDLEDSPSEIKDPCRNSEDADEAYARILRMCAATEKSEQQVRERLARLGYGESDVQAAIERALKAKVIDNLRYAESLIRMRLRQGKGLASITREVNGLGYELADIPGWPDEFDCQDDDGEGELRRAMAYLKQRPPHARNARDAAYRKLLQRGYSSAIAAKAARMWHEETHER